MAELKQQRPGIARREQGFKNCVPVVYALAGHTVPFVDTVIVTHVNCNNFFAEGAHKRFICVGQHVICVKTNAQPAVTGEQLCHTVNTIA